MAVLRHFTSFKVHSQPWDEGTQKTSGRKEIVAVLFGEDGKAGPHLAVLRDHCGARLEPKQCGHLQDKCLHLAQASPLAAVWAPRE